MHCIFMCACACGRKLTYVDAPGFYEVYPPVLVRDLAGRRRSVPANARGGKMWMLAVFATLSPLSLFLSLSFSSKNDFPYGKYKQGFRESKEVPVGKLQITTKRNETKRVNPSYQVTLWRPPTLHTAPLDGYNTGGTKTSRPCSGSGGGAGVNSTTVSADVGAAAVAAAASGAAEAVGSNEMMVNRRVHAMRSSRDSARFKFWLGIVRYRR